MKVSQGWGFLKIVFELLEGSAFFYRMQSGRAYDFGVAGDGKGHCLE